MASSFAPHCSELKQKYDTCFNDWYANSFLKGTGESINPCEDVFEKYKSCISTALTKRGMEGILEEARREQPYEKTMKRGTNSTS